MTKEIFLLLNLALAFYNTGTIWAHEVDIFRTWKLIDGNNFHLVQDVHWKKLPYWVFVPVGISFIGAIMLIWYHPDVIPDWEIWLALGFQLLSHILTALFWGQWQANLAKDPLGSKSRYLDKILKTHWVRTLLINAYGLMLLIIAIQAFT